MNIQDIQAITRSDNLDAIATLLVGAMFGWEAQEAPQEPRESSTCMDMVHHYYGDPNALTVKVLRQMASSFGISGWWNMRKAQLILELENMPAEERDLEDAFTCVTTEDKETERFITVRYQEDDHPNAPWIEEQVPTWAFNTNKYECLSGENPVTEDIAAKNDKLCRNINEVPAPFVNFYSTSKSWPRERWAVQESNMHKILRFIWKHREDKNMLRRGWRRLWQRVYAQKNWSFLHQKQIQLIKKTFNELGIQAKGK